MIMRAGGRHSSLITSSPLPDIAWTSERLGFLDLEMREKIRVTINLPPYPATLNRP